uniref:Uncharacterized protein n=1 Tax=viral metagenome TaxID=1070528 RepID=A0A6C0CRJ9_9ZZZZ
MRRSIINIPYQNTVHRILEVPKNQLERLKSKQAIQKYDLIWLSEIQDPYEQLTYYDSNSQIWKIPSTLALVTDIYYDDTNCIWTLLVNDRVLFNDYKVLYTVGVYISDVVANHSEYLRKTKAAATIQKYYKRHYFTRNLMAKRIQRIYIQHYWNPNNPNMLERLQNEYQMFYMEINLPAFRQFP